MEVNDVPASVQELQALPLVVYGAVGPTLRLHGDAHMCGLPFAQRKESLRR